MLDAFAPYRVSAIYRGRASAATMVSPCRRRSQQAGVSTALGTTSTSTPRWLAVAARITRLALRTSGAPRAASCSAASAARVAAASAASAAERRRCRVRRLLDTVSEVALEGADRHLSVGPGERPAADEIGRARHHQAEIGRGGAAVIA